MSNQRGKIDKLFADQLSVSPQEQEYTQAQPPQHAQQPQPPVHAQQPRPSQHVQQSQPPVHAQQPRPSQHAQPSQPSVHAQQSQPPGHAQHPQPPVHEQQPQPPVHAQHPQPPVHEQQPQPPVHEQQPRPSQHAQPSQHTQPQPLAPGQESQPTQHLQQPRPSQHGQPPPLEQESKGHVVVTKTHESLPATGSKAETYKGEEASNPSQPTTSPENTQKDDTGRRSSLWKRLWTRRISKTSKSSEESSLNQLDPTGVVANSDKRRSTIEPRKGRRLSEYLDYTNEFAPKISVVAKSQGQSDDSDKRRSTIEPRKGRRLSDYLDYTNEFAPKNRTADAGRISQSRRSSEDQKPRNSRKLSEYREYEENNPGRPKPSTSILDAEKSQSQFKNKNKRLSVVSEDRKEKGGGGRKLSEYRDYPGMGLESGRQVHPEKGSR